MQECERATVSVALTGEPGLIEQLTRALADVVERFGERPSLEIGEAGYWAQDGGWYLVVDDGWSQEGGWVEDLEGVVAMRAYGGRPTESIVRDVWAALDRVKPDPNWEQSWDPYPQPKPGPGPDPVLDASLDAAPSDEPTQPPHRPGRRPGKGER